MFILKEPSTKTPARPSYPRFAASTTGLTRHASLSSYHAIAGECGCSFPGPFARDDCEWTQPINSFLLRCAN